MSAFLKLVGDRIRVIRKSKGLTQEQLAEKTSLQYTYIGGVERGERNISLETLEKIIDGLDVTAYVLFKMEDSDAYNELLDKKKQIDGISDILIDRDMQEIKMIQRIINELLTYVDANK